MKNKIPKVSIIIPVYNREKIIEETLKSALDQTYDDFEIIVIDNKSTDNTYELLEKKYAQNLKVKLFKNNENLGPVRNWKKCIEEASGEYIKILWSDDQISKDFLEVTVPILEKNIDIGFIYSKVLIYGENFKKENYNFGKTGKYEILSFIKSVAIGPKSVPVSPGCALFRKKDIEKNLVINLENPKKLDFSKYGAGNDLLLFLLTYPEYKYFYYIDEIKSYFRAHNDSFSISNNLVEYYNYSIVYFLEKHHELKELKEIRDLFYTKLFLKNKYMIKNKKYNFKYGYIVKKIVHKILNFKRGK